MLQLNITTSTDLCRLYTSDMVYQGGSRIINAGSMPSLSRIPYASVYSASKAYLLMFSEGVRHEYQDKRYRSWRFYREARNLNLPGLQHKSRKN